MNAVLERFGDFLSRHGLVLLVLGLIAMVWLQHGALQNAKELSELKAEGVEIRAERDNLKRERDRLAADIRAAEKDRDAAQAAEKVALQEVDALKSENKKIREASLREVFNMRALRTEDDLEKQFSETYPDVQRDANFGVIDITTNEIIYPYMLIPAWYTGIFLEEHGKMVAAEKQVANYVEMEGKYGTITELRARADKATRKIGALQKQVTAAVDNANSQCQVRLDSTRERYEEKLNEPQFKVPGAWVFAGCAAATVGGVVLGTQF